VVPKNGRPGNVVLVALPNRRAWSSIALHLHLFFLEYTRDMRIILLRRGMKLFNYNSRSREDSLGTRCTKTKETSDNTLPDYSRLRQPSRLAPDNVP